MYNPEIRTILSGTLPSIAQWFTLAVPVPTERSKAVQLGCHLEEVGEMLTALGLQVPANIVDHWGHGYKTDGVPPQTVNRKELLDSLADQIVTAVGIAHMYGFDIQGALSEVNCSNYSKFDANGKIAKNMETYFKPDLTRFLGN